MMKHFIYFLFTVFGMYSVMVTYSLISNNQFSYEYKWDAIIAVTTSISINIFAYFMERKKKKEPTKN